MSWVPSGIDTLDSFILLADNSQFIQKMDPFANIQGGFWVSASYARGSDPFAEYTIKTISFEYVVDAVPANVKVYTDPDGASNFTLLKQMDLIIHSVGKANLASVFAGVTGKDPRVKLELNPNTSSGNTFAIRSINIEVVERPRL